jgi:hypothetical protein
MLIWPILAVLLVAGGLLVVTEPQLTRARRLLASTLFLIAGLVLLASLIETSRASAAENRPEVDRALLRTQ